MILLDTHIWIWWVHGSDSLTRQQSDRLKSHEDKGLGISVISCWEVAKLVQYNRVTLPLPLGEWTDQALSYPGLILLPLTPEIAIESTQLPGSFHRDPADQIIAATARIHSIALLTQDQKIIAYPHVETL